MYKYLMPYTPAMLHQFENLSNFLYRPVSYFWEHEKQKYKNEFLLEFHGGRKVSTIHEFSSDDLMDVRDPPFSSHIFWIKSKIINLIDWLVLLFMFVSFEIYYLTSASNVSSLILF